MKIKTFIRFFVATLVLLFTGTMSSWSADYNKVHEDPSGDSYRCKGSSSSIFIDLDDDAYFNTYKRFDPEKDNFYFDFDFRVNFITGVLGWSIGSQHYKGEIYLVTSDDVRHRVATWEKKFNQETTTTYYNSDDTWGFILISALHHDGRVTVQFTPSTKAFEDGVKRIEMKHTMTLDTSLLSTDLGWAQYEKEIDCTGIAVNKPMPKLSIEWGDDGRLKATAAGVSDKRNSNAYIAQYYWFYVNYYKYGRTKSQETFSTDRDNVSYSNVKDGKMDMTFNYWPETQAMETADYVYTVPVYVDYRANLNVKPGGYLGLTQHYLRQPQVEGVLIEPFTRPETVSVELDKWEKKNLVKWTYQDEARGYDGKNDTYVTCRRDGKWYVIRYDKNGKDTEYKQIGELNGDAEILEMVDDHIDYDKQYVYRVIFLPTILESKYKDQLTRLPGYNRQHNVTDLWEEVTASTTLDVPIVLLQDKTYLDGVRLKWEYSIPLQGLRWSIDYRSANTQNTWRTMTETINVDTDRSEAVFDTSGSTCDFVDYRIHTTVNGREVYSNIYSANLPAGSYISEVTASTGTEENTVTVKWKVVRPDSEHDNYFRVLRRIVGVEEWTLLTDEIHGTVAEYSYIDDRVMAGSYYEYSVQAYGALCDEQIVKSDEVIAPGFSQARGTITGHISYGTGTSVGGVKVNLVKASADEPTDQQQFFSRFIDGEGKGLQWTADSAKYVNVLNGGKELTLQLWAKPMGSLHANPSASGTEDCYTLLHLKNALELGVKMGDNGFYLCAIDNSWGGTTVKEFPKLLFSNTDFTHIAATYKPGQWTFYVGTDTLLTASMNVESIDWHVCDEAKTSSFISSSSLSVGGSNRICGGAFTGNVDDIRLWNRALTQKEIEINYTRILGGSEEGLLLYWPLDEGINIKNYAFDVARQDGIYLLNHPEVGVNARPDTNTPLRLGLYGVTDSKGNYIIRGIPFQQGGTNYEITPELGIHQFNPITRSMFVSPTSLTANNIDFEDVSSFPMEGYIYYAGTNVPAEGIMFYVDGELLSGNGEVKKTDEKGFYQISVPIGEHYVEAKLDGHKMVGNGRFPTTGTFNFDRAMKHDFLDSTLVNFVGRVSGGVRNDTLAVGFGASKNNIGTATITLKLNNESMSFNCLDEDHISPATANRPWDSDTTSISSHSWTGFGSDSKYIYITTDTLTGEFSAMLPPLKYITKSIRIDKNPDVEFTTLPEIDLTSVQKEMTDSLKQPRENGDSVWNYYTYNTKMVKTYYAQPQLVLWQVDGDGGFGERELKDYAVNTAERMDITDIWTRGDDGSISYTYDYPVFARQKEYKFGVRGFEAYTNYDSGTAVTDSIPMNDQVLTIANEMSDIQDVVAKVTDPTVTDLKEGAIYNLKRNQLLLDSIGTNEITFTTGVPNVTAPYTRQFSIVYERNDHTYSGPQLNGVVLGELTNGNNFVTDGPDHVSMVLRDPPGAKGKATWKSGTSHTTIDSKTNGVYWDNTIQCDLIWGTELSTVVGFGVALISGSKATTTFNTGVKSSFTWQWKDEKTYVYTTAENISTSTGSKYVGANGDLFIGQSHNFIIGTCRKVGFHREADGIKLGLKDAVSINDSIKTDFIYSALEIKETMIPKIEDSRNMLLEYMDSISAVGYQNTTDQDVYLTWLTKDNPRYGQEGTYLWKRAPNVNSQDMVLHYNESMRMWRERLAENERDKVEAFMDPIYFKENRSFDGGASYTYSERRDTTKTSTYTANKKAGFVGDYKTGFYVNSAGSFGMNINFKEEIGYTGNRIKGDSLDNVKSYVEFDYDLNDGNPGTDFTVDIYESPRGWGDIFLLRGGQSYNPYESEEKTQWFEKGEHVISYGTQQMEQPDIKISTDGLVGAKSAVLTDVPAGQTGQFTLHLTNNSTTNQPTPFTYILSVSEGSNQKGLEILMDGVPANGRGVYVPEGETVKKIITVRQTDQSVLDYEDVELWFASSYQSIKIHDSAKLSVHFKPSSSAVDLAITEPVLNTESQNGRLEMKVMNFDRQFKNLKNVGVQYRFSGNTQWTNLHTWVTDKADSISTAYSMLPKTGDLRWEEDMSSDLSYPEGTYEFRAFTATPYDQEIVYVYSDVITVTKDMTRPRNLYTPAPSNGILGYGDELAIEFNEDIVPGYVGDKNVIVTAKLNGQPVNHEVSLQLTSFGEQTRTANPMFLSGNFSMEFWLKWHESGTIMHQGTGEKNFALMINNEGHAVISIAGFKFTSFETLPKDEWTFFALNYNASTMTFNLLAQYGTTSVELFKNEKVTKYEVQTISYAEDNYLYLGPIDANIHDLALYSTFRDVAEAGTKKYESKDGYVYGLTNYWPMNEGHGTVATDMRHTHDFQVLDSWKLENLNYALHMDDDEGVTADITKVNTSRNDSYAIELWYNPAGDADTDEVVFETGTPTIEGDKLPRSDKLRLRYDKLHNLVLDYGNNSQTVAAANFYQGPIWYHLALNVVRGQAASFYLNGQRTAVIAETEVPMFEGTTMTLGKGAQMNNIDELRIWKATLTESRLLGNMYNTIDTTDVYARGLVAYYPFEKTGLDNGITTKVHTMENMAPRSAYREVAGDMQSVGATVAVKNTPPLKNAPDETRLTASPVASERKVVINLSGSTVSARDIEGTTLNITLSDIRDLHGNASNPIKWNAYVQQNTLKWNRDSVNIFKQYGNGYSFDVTIENKGGHTEYYTLYNMPQWLTVVGSSTVDDLAPLKSKTLRFEVSPLVAVGNYDVTIGLQGNNEIIEPLRIVMKVSGQKPDWSVDPTKYENQMNVIGQVYVNGILMENSESLVAAFIGDECRGIAAPEREYGAAYVTMTIYGTGTPASDLKKPITFYIWDASKGVAYTDVIVSGLPIGLLGGISFIPDRLYGSFENPIIWTKGNKVEQQLKLNEKWNWISLGIEPEDKRPVAVFPELTTWQTIIKDKKSSIVYSNGVEWRGNLQVEPATMYKMMLQRLDNSKELSNPMPVSGRQLVLSETPISLQQGWNWIGYTPLTTMNIAEALAGVQPQKGDRIKSQTAISIYNGVSWAGSLKAMESGRGYMYYSSDDEEKSFVYPNVETTQSRSQSAFSASSTFSSIFNPINSGEYSENMSMVIQLIGADGSPIDTCEVAAFINGECRGATRAIDGLYYLIISGEGSGQQMEIATCINGKIRMIDDNSVYTSDYNIGTPWEPYVIDLNISGITNGIEDIDDSQNDDSRFGTGEWYTLDGRKVENRKLVNRSLSKGVYIHKGNKIVVK